MVLCASTHLVTEKPAELHLFLRRLRELAPWARRASLSRFTLEIALTLQVGIRGHGAIPSFSGSISVLDRSLPARG